MNSQPRNVQGADSTAPTRRCDNPECDARMEWSGSRGRPSLYCSDACRQRTSDSAKRLQERITELQTHLATGDATYRQRRAIATEVSRLRWLLSAYPASFREPPR